MSEFVFFNWFLCVITALLLALIIWRYRFLIIKPSIIVIAIFHIQIQWAAAVQSGYIEYYLPHPYAFLLLSQVFPLLGLVVSFFVMHKKTISVYAKLSNCTIWSLKVKARALVFLFTGILIIVLVYLTIVPLSGTGIYAVLVDPLQSTEARESSLKLLDSTLLKYSFSLLKSALAPLLSALAVIFFIQGIRKMKILQSLWSIFIFLFTLAAVLLPGARMPAAALFLTIVLALFIIRKMPIRPLYIAISLLVILVLPIVMTIFREGQEFNLSMFVDYMKGGIFRRMFVVPMETGLWHVHYGQELGFAGAAGIPKLAGLMNIAPLNLGNLIYLKYSSYYVFSGLANTSFVFGYYACFGIVSLAFSMVGLWALDLAVLVFDKLKNNALRLAAVASIGISCFGFINSMYTTALITNGFVFILILAVILDRLWDFSLEPKSQNEGRT